MYRIEENDTQTILVEEPSANYGYTYADYLKWKVEERIELFKGRILKLAAPNTNHQRVCKNIFLHLTTFLKNKTCEVFIAPFDVRLPVHNLQTDDEVTTVVHPDLCIICNPQKIDTRGCCGAPDVMIEILSPGNSRKEVRLKYDLYEEAGVLEYWLVNPVEENLIAYTLDNTQKFAGGKMYASGDTLYSKAITGLAINVTDIFENL